MNEFIKSECKICFNAIRIGCGTKIINGKRTHFDRYGCESEECIVDGESFEAYKDSSRRWLKAIRKDRGLTIRDASIVIGISQSKYSNIEQGRTNEPMLLKKVAECFEFDLSRFRED